LVYSINNFRKSRDNMRVAALTQFHHDPTSAHLVRNCSRRAGTREEVEPELREMFQVPPELRLLWVVPIGHALAWPKAKPRRSSAAFTHWETYDGKKLRPESNIQAWPKN
jgi:hypothetical protein